MSDELPSRFLIDSLDSQHNLIVLYSWWVHLRLLDKLGMKARSLTLPLSNPIANIARHL